MPRQINAKKPVEEDKPIFPTDKAAAIQRELAQPVNELSVIRLMDSIIQFAHESRASDIHIEPEEKRVLIRFRIDGILHDQFILPRELHLPVITRIKVMSGLRTDEHQAAQDGRFKVAIDTEGHFDIRVSIAPTYYGENAILRILTEQAKAITLEGSGLNEKDMKLVKKAILKPYGMILVTGPTGSGKTTTLYSILKILNTREVSIITIEDPIEYSIEGIDQIQVNPQTNLTFAKGLRSILRQDPNIIMVGEIRDEETAGIAVNAALTGHLLLSTIHTNDAATTLPRLLDMNIEPFLIASTVNIAIGQRLVRLICNDCKEKYILTDSELKSLQEVIRPELLRDNRQFYKGRGCSKCTNSGYFGRIGIFEVLEINESIRELINKKADSDALRSQAIKNGMVTMIEDGFKKAVAGITSIEEILRVIHE